MLSQDCGYHTQILRVTEEFTREKSLISMADTKHGNKDLTEARNIINNKIFETRLIQWSESLRTSAAVLHERLVKNLKQIDLAALNSSCDLVS